MSFEDLKLTAGLVLLSPYLPLLFMGEEYGECAPFQYFVSHSDPELIEAVRKGRRREFAAFEWNGGIPDPQAESTFQVCKLQHSLRRKGNNGVLYDFTRELIRLRKSLRAPAPSCKGRREVVAYEKEKLLWINHASDGKHEITICNLSGFDREIALPLPALRMRRVLDSGDQRWGGPGSTAPEVLEPDCREPLTLAAKSLLLYTAEVEEDH